MLFSSELGPEYWSFILFHAVYIKNRIIHFSMNKTLYEMFTGKILNLSSLRIFGSKVYCRKSGKKQTKLDRHDSVGMFLGYTTTEKNIRDMDDAT